MIAPTTWPAASTPVSGRYRLAIGANVPNGNFVSRADVAHAMLALLDDPASVKAPVGVAL